jgi:hypothetical protein
MKFSYIFLSSLLLVLAACKLSEKPKCPFGSPQAIFDENMPGVEEDDFVPNAQGSTERVFFKNGLALELVQSGCEQLVQEYTLSMAGDKLNQRPDSFWVESASAMFDFFASIDPKLAPFSFWAESIRQRRADIKLGQPFELEGGRFVKIDRIANESSAKLLLEISLQKENQ